MKKILVVLFVSIFIFTGCSSDSEEAYKLEGVFASTTESYGFAVEVDDYDGDVYKAGYYSFASTSTNGKASVYNIYVLTENIEDVNTLNDANPSCVVGGVDAAGCSLELQKGDYVYVVPQPVEYDVEGYLQIKKINAPFY